MFGRTYDINGMLIMPDTNVAFGHGRLPITLPDGAQPVIILKTPLPKLADPKEAISHAMANPVGSLSLRNLAQGRKNACIAICDITRPVPNHLFLGPMIRTLMAGGIALADITVLVATGLHRPNEGDELRALVGDPWVFDHVRLLNHDARAQNDLVSLGVTPGRSTPVTINRHFMEAELRIVTGLIEPHFMAGWSGGRKVIAPGIAGHETIRTFHSARFLENPASISCNFDGNPLHEEQLAIVRMIGDVYALNTILDDERDLVFVNFGDIVASHTTAVDVARSSIRVPVPRRFTTVVTSAAGYPLDKTYYQTIKAMVSPLDILEPGGTLIVASECSEGMGSTEFRAAQEHLMAVGAKEFLARLTAKTFADVDEWQTEMLLKAKKTGTIRLYTAGLSEADRVLSGVHIVHCLEQAIAESLNKYQDNTLAIIPEGPYVAPYVDRTLQHA